MKSLVPLLSLIAFSRAGALQSFNVADLRAAIANARAGSRVSIPAGTYNIGNTPIRIEDKRNVEIVGAGKGKTIIRSGASAPYILELAGSNVNLTIANMSLEGAPRLSKNTHGLASGFDRMNLTGARFHDLDIKNVAVGISVVGSGTGICNDVEITSNNLNNIQDVMTAGGVTSGSGYGIHNEGCTNVRIADNVLRNVDRHAIYQASAYQPDRPPATGSNVIERNTIIDHAMTSSLDNYWLVAIVVARSSNVIVRDNEIINPYHDAISIENPPREGKNYSVRNISVTGNTVRGGRGMDLFLTAAGSFTFSGNRFYHVNSSSPTSIPVVRRDGEGNAGKVIAR